MAKLTRILQNIFGINAGVDERAQIGSLAAGTPAFTNDPVAMQALDNFKQGLYGVCIGENSPSLEDINALYFLVTRQLAYILQQGVAEWDSETDYHIGQICSENGTLFVSIQDDNLNNDLTDVLWWREYGAYFAANIVDGKTIPLATWDFVFPGSEIATDTTLAVNAFQIVPFKKSKTMLVGTLSADQNTLFEYGDSPEEGIAESEKVPTLGANYRCAAVTNDERFVAVGLAVTSSFKLFRNLNNVLTVMTDPASMPTGFVQAMSFSPRGDLLAVAHNTAPYVNLYQKKGNTFIKLTDPTSLGLVVGVPAIYDCKFSPDGRYLVITHSISATGTYMTVMKLNKTAGSYSIVKIADSYVVTSTFSGRIVWHPSSAFFVTSGTDVGVYKIVADAVTLSSSSLFASANPIHIDISPDGDYIVFGFGTSVQVYKFSNLDGNWNYENDLPNMSATITGVAFSNNGASVIVTDTQPSLIPVGTVPDLKEKYPRIKYIK